MLFMQYVHAISLFILYITQHGCTKYYLMAGVLTIIFYCFIFSLYIWLSYYLGLDCRRCNPSTLSLYAREATPGGDGVVSPRLTSLSSVYFHWPLISAHTSCLQGFSREETLVCFSPLGSFDIIYCYINLYSLFRHQPLCSREVEVCSLLPFFAFLFLFLL